MNVPYAWSLYILAVGQSLFGSNPNKNKPQSSRTMQLLANFSDEEFMNVFFMVFLIPSGRYLKMAIQLCLCIWAVMHVCAMAGNQLKANPGTIGLSALKRPIEWVNLSKVEVSMVKSKIEIGIALIAIPAVFMSQAALIFPIMYFQYIRVKYVSNQIMKYSFKLLNIWLKANMPSFLYDSFLFQWGLNWLSGYVNFKKEGQGNNEEKESSSEL